MSKFNPRNWFKPKPPTPKAVPSEQYSAPIGPARPSESGGTGVLPSKSVTPTPVNRSSGGGSSGSSSYQGPVPQGANEQAFRETGQTIQSQEQQRIQQQTQANQQEQQRIQQQAQANAVAQQQKVEQQRAIQEKVQQQKAQQQRGTIVQQQRVNTPAIITQPFIEKRTVGFDKDSRGRNIPSTQLVYVEPTWSGPNRTGEVTMKERPLTGDERLAGKFQTDSGEVTFDTRQQLVASTEKLSSTKKIKDSISIAGENIKDSISIAGENIKLGAIQTYESVNTGLKKATTAINVDKTTDILLKTSKIAPVNLAISNIGNYKKQAEKFGDILKDPTLLKGYVPFKKKADVVYDFTTGEARKPLQDKGDIVYDLDKGIARLGVDDFKKPANLNPTGEDFLKGYIQGNVQDIKDKPLKQAVILGGSFGAGAGVKGGQILVTAGGKALAGAKGAKFASNTYQGVVGGLGLGFGVQGVNALSTDLQGASAFEAGKTVGVVAKDVGLGITGFSAGSKAVGYRFEEIKVKIPARDIKEPKFKEVQTRVIKDGTEKVISELKIVGERKPPINVVETTKFRLDKGLPPKKILYTEPAKNFQVKPVFGKAVVGESYVAQRINLGVRGKPFKQVRLSTVSGESVKFNPRLDIPKMSKVERFTLQRFFERKTGKIAPKDPKRLANLFAKDAELTATYIKEFNYGKVQPFKQEFKLSTRGKRTSRTVGISEDKLVLETDKIQLFKSGTEFKDVTKPFSRASGKTTSLSGEIVVIKEPVILDQPKNIGFKIEGGPKTPLSSTFQQQVQSSVSVPSLAKQLPPSILSSPKTTTTITSKPLPSISSSQFAGLGLYEQTRTETSSFQRISKDTRSVVLTRNTPIEVTRQIETPITSTITRSSNRNIFRQEPAIKQEPVSKEIVKQQNKQQSKQLQKELTKQIYKQSSLPKMFNPFKPIIPKKTTVVTPFKLPKGMGMQRPKGLFGVEVRRGGVFRNIGTTRDLQSALSLGQANTKNTLARSFRIIGGNVRVPKGFYRSKTLGKDVIVQSARTSLSSKREKEEIQMFRNLKKKPKKRKKKLGLFDFI